MALGVDHQELHRHQLAEHRAPFLAAELGSDAERAEPGVAEPAHALGVLAEQHVDDVGGAEHLPGAPDARQRLPRRHGAVEARHRLEAGVAVAARLGERLAEVFEQHLAAAARGLAIADQRVELAVLDLLLAVGRSGLGDQVAQLGDVAGAVDHPRIRRQPVASGAAGLLVIGLEALRQVEVRDEADVRLVDTHAEGDGGDHDDPLLLEEPVLVPGPHRLVEAGVVRQRLVARGREALGDILDPGAGQAVDDARIAAVPAPDEGVELGGRAVLGGDGVADVGAVETGGEHAPIVEAQALDDVALGGLIRGGGDGDAGHRRETVLEHRELEVLGPEVVAPLRDAMGLVDGEQREFAAPQMVEKRGHEQPLGRDVDEIERAGAHLGFGAQRFAVRQRRVERGGAHAELRERLDLVAHERDQRRHHDRDTGPAQRRNLIAQRLAEAGRHQHQRIAAGDDVVDNLGLEAPERIEPENRAQDVERWAGHGSVYTTSARNGNRRRRRRGRTRRY